MTKELPVPGQQQGQKEPFLRRRVTRRAVLAGGAAAMAGSAAFAVLGTRGREEEKPELVQVQTQPTVEAQKEAPYKELPAANWTIEADPKIPLNKKSEYPFNRTVQEDLQIIQATIDTLPKIGQCRIILTSSDLAGGRPSLNYDTEIPEIYIVRETFPDFMKSQIYHEFTHLFDPKTNYKVLPELLDLRDIKALNELKAQALSDGVFLPNVPYMERMFDKEKSKVNWDFSRTFTPAQLAKLVTIYPDLYWLVQGPSVEYNRSEFLFGPYLSQSLEAIKRYSQEIGMADYSSLGDFFSANKTRIDDLSQKDKVIGKAFDILRAKHADFGIPNFIWAAGRFPGVQFEGKSRGDWWRGVPFLVNGVLAEGIETQNPEVVGLFAPDKARQIKINLVNFRGETENERFAELGSATLMYRVQTPFTPYFERLKTIAARSKSK